MLFVRRCFRAVSKEEDTDDLLTVQTGLLIKDAFELIKCKLSKKKKQGFSIHDVYCKRL